MKQVLFVCSGNTCRSAMAEGIARDLLEKYPEKYGHIAVASAGTFADDGGGASPLAQAVADKHGISLADFASRQVNNDLLGAADVVLAMTGDHKKLLNALNPEAMDRIFLLKEYAAGENVNDLNVKMATLFEQYGQSRENFVKGNGEALAELDRLSKTDPAAAETLFHRLNNELKEGLAEFDEEINALSDRIAALDIRDPYGGSEADYEACYQELAQEIGKAFEKLTLSE